MFNILQRIIWGFHIQYAILKAIQSVGFLFLKTGKQLCVCGGVHVINYFKHKVIHLYLVLNCVARADENLVAYGTS